MRRAPPYRAYARDEEGSVSILTAGGAMLLMAAAALAVDVGSVFLQSRQLQGVADLAAISAARDLANAETAAQATADVNRWSSPLTVSVSTGSYAPNPALAPKDRFTAGAPKPNAARVVVRGDAELYFAQVVLGRDSLPISRTATAARAELASFSIGTRLAALEGGIANQLLSQLTGSTVSLSVMDYDALAKADVDLFAYTRALQTSADLTGVSFEKVLESDISTGEALSVLGDVLATGGDASAAAAARKMAQAAGVNTPAELNRVLDLGPYGRQDQISAGSGAKIGVSAMALADAILLLSGEGRQVKLDLGAGVPGLADVDIWLAIGERANQSPWLSIDDDDGVVVRTAQARVYAEAKALGALGVLGLQPIKVPILLEAASGEAKLSSLECPDNLAAQAATLSVRPGLGTASLGEIDKTKLNDFTRALTVSKAQLLDLALVKASATAKADIGGATWKSVRFSRADIDTGKVKSVATDDIAEASMASLLSSADVTVNILGLGLGIAPITAALKGVLTAAAAPLDGVINGLTELLGVRLGEADVRVHGLRCRAAALVA